jgi:hypothetical protein
LCANNNIEYINLTCGSFSTQGSGQKPPTTHLIHRVWFNWGVGGHGEVILLVLSKCPFWSIWVECWSNINTPSSTLYCRQVDQKHFYQTAFSLIEVWVTRRGEFLGKLMHYFVIEHSISKTHLLVTLHCRRVVGWSKTTQNPQTCHV